MQRHYKVSTRELLPFPASIAAQQGPILTPPEQHKVKVIKKQSPQPHPSVNIADCNHCATLICKLEKGLQSGCFTDPAIKSNFPQTGIRSC